MKPLHYGLLAAGATLAAGLAITMTQPAPDPVQDATPVQPLRAAPPVIPSAKPSPLAKSIATPPPALSAAATAAAQPAVQSKPSIAPAAVYTPAPKQPIRKNEPIREPKPARKNEPVVIAKATPPSDWKPTPYQDPPHPSQAKTPQPKVQQAPAAPPPVVVQQPVPAQAVPQPTEEKPSPEPLPAFAPLPPRRVTLKAGTTIPVRLDESLSSERNTAGERFQASLAESVVVNGLEIAEKGALVWGRIVDARPASLKLELAEVSTSDGQHIAISTDPWMKRSEESPGQQAGIIGGGAAVGAIIGAIAGGGEGAAIGAGIGGAAGAGSVFAMRGRPAKVPSETIIRFRLATRVTITEQQIAGR